MHGVSAVPLLHSGVPFTMKLASVYVCLPGKNLEPRPDQRIKVASHSMHQYGCLTKAPYLHRRALFDKINDIGMTRRQHLALMSL